MGWPASKDVQAYLLNRPVVLSFHEEVLSDRVKDEQALFFFFKQCDVCYGMDKGAECE